MAVLAYKTYQQLLIAKLGSAFAQANEISLAATCMANCMKNEGWIYISGTGHSHLFAEEIFYRAGGFARVRPILAPKLMLHESATGSTLEERREGYAQELLQDYPIGPKDMFIISSNSGRNAVSIEMGQYARKMGAKVIVLTNLAHSKSVSSRHASGLKLYEVGDLVLDNFGEIGDASIDLPGLAPRVGATSTVIGTALLQAICVEAAAILLQEGLVPEVFSSSNSDEGESHNEALLRKYKPLVNLL
jgi:uncharacterized phosphosugar-binding protein